MDAWDEALASLPTSPPLSPTATLAALQEAFSTLSTTATKEATASATEIRNLHHALSAARDESLLLRQQNDDLKAELARLNDLNASLITSLRRALGSSSSSSPSSSSSSSAASAAASSPSTSRSGLRPRKAMAYRYEEGETVGDVAAKFGVSARELRRLNGVPTDGRLQAMDSILIPITSQALAWELQQKRAAGM